MDYKVFWRKIGSKFLSQICHFSALFVSQHRV